MRLTRHVAAGLVPMFVAYVATGQPAPATAMPGVERELLSLLQALDKAASTRDRAEFAALVQFPITVQASGLAIPVAKLSGVLTLLRLSHDRRCR